MKYNKIRKGFQTVNNLTSNIIVLTALFTVLVFGFIDTSKQKEDKQEYIQYFVYHIKRHSVNKDEKLLYYISCSSYDINKNEDIKIKMDKLCKTVEFELWRDSLLMDFNLDESLKFPISSFDQMICDSIPKRYLKIEEAINEVENTRIRMSKMNVGNIIRRDEVITCTP